MKSVIDIIKVIAGVILIIIGLIGGLIPIFQGWVFGIPGLMLLGSVFPPVKKWTHNMVEKAKNKMRR
ncbi:MAG: hypothetical protein OXR70_00860 [Candidatus Marinimicrobia bacterium]|nr:hypothetical protein [Candidatus Neomarinimicrobiota bacterium]MDD9887603.1 hypothetical protein [Candidatus Neomarinimicrobiota bacterium]MDD9930399.1 hypothetical protein [Candidatus Neomarinimicrobiota bacterium]|tara:strand:- start:249 stop:449 length:201 start_codon:yes stop_codon:yes gene_type:complete